jgi:hypothetical protein
MIKPNGKENKTKNLLRFIKHLHKNRSNKFVYFYFYDFDCGGKWQETEIIIIIIVDELCTRQSDNYVMMMIMDMKR